MIESNYTLELTAEELEFTNAYIEAFYFADTGETESGQPASDAELSEELQRSIVIDCLAFYTRNNNLIGDNVEQAGHDFYLTRCGHGVGFWDRPEIYGDGIHDSLSERASAFGNAEYYSGDDGLIYG